jgi:hypothetical protein
MTGDKVAFALEGDRLVLAPTKAGSARLVKGPRGRKVLVAPHGAAANAQADPRYSASYTNSHKKSDL